MHKHVSKQLIGHKLLRHVEMQAENGIEVNSEFPTRQKRQKHQDVDCK